MEVHFEATRQFEKDVSSFSPEDRRRILYTVNTLGVAPKQMPLRKLRVGSEEYESTLFTVRVNPNIRIIFSFDDDPVFERTLITLFRAVKHDELDRAMRSVRKSISQELRGEKKRRS